MAMYDAMAYTTDEFSHPVGWEFIGDLSHPDDTRPLAAQVQVRRFLAPDGTEKVIKKLPNILGDSAQGRPIVRRVFDEVEVPIRLRGVPGVTPVEHVYTRGYDLYVAMPFLGVPPAAGEDFDEARRIVRTALLAVASLHGSGVLHRDIKRLNLLYSPPSPAAEGGVGRTHLCDFGSVSEVEAEDQTARVTTLEYMAPDAYTTNTGRLEYGAETDVWSLGVLGLELLSGLPPWGGADVRVLKNHLMEIAAVIGPIPDGLRYRKPHAAATATLPPDVAARGAATLEALRARAGERADAAEAFVRAAMEWNPTLRPTAAELAGHPLFDGLGPSPRVLARVEPSVLPPADTAPPEEWAERLAQLDRLARMPPP